MKSKIILLAAGIFITSLSAFGQKSRTQETSNEVTNASQDDNYFPIYNENVFGYNKDIFYSLTWFLDGDAPDAFVHFINAGISKNFGISLGAIANDVVNVGDPDQFYFSPEFNFPLQEKLYLSVHLKTIKAGDAFLFKPAVFAGFGTPGQHLAIGYSPSIDDEGNYNQLGFGDFAYTGGGIRLQGRYPLFLESNYTLSLFGKGEYGTVSSAFIDAKFNSIAVGLEFQIKRFNIYSAYQRYSGSFGGNSNSDQFISLGVSVSILGR